MSGANRFSYHQAQEINGSYKGRHSVASAPFVLCVFIVGIILMGVGTFITTHPNDPILIVVGPVLLGFGGLMLFGTVVICAVACCKNSRVQEAFSDDFLNIGASTFYGGRGFAYLVNEDQLQQTHASSNQLQNLNEGITNLAGPNGARNSQQEGVMFLANTVAEERNRQQRKLSYANNTAVLPHNSVESCMCNTTNCNHLYMNNPNPAMMDQLDHLGLEKLRRADPYPELARDFDLGEGPYLSPSVRDRSASVLNRPQAVPGNPVPHRLRRNVTYSSATRARVNARKLHQQQHQDLFQQLSSDFSPKWKRRYSQRRAVDRTPPSGTPESVKIHHLPQYDPDLLKALGITKTRSGQIRFDSNNDVNRFSPRLTAKAQAGRALQESGQGSLGRPPKRPSVVMGVQLLGRQPSGSAYRHKSSIYASDMSLHRQRDGLTVEEELSEGTAYDQRLGRPPLPPSKGGRRIPKSPSFTTGSASEIDRLRIGPQSTWSSSSSIQVQGDGNQNGDSSSPPKSPVSSCCGSRCNSDGSLQFSCSGCESESESIATGVKEQH